MTKRISKFLPALMDCDDPKLASDNFYQVRREGRKLVYYARVGDEYYGFITEYDRKDKLRSKARELMLESAVNHELNFSGDDMRELLSLLRRLK